MVYPHLNLHILLIVMVQLAGPVVQILRIGPITKIRADNRPFCRHDLVSVRILPNFKLIQVLVKWIYGINFGAIHKKMLSESRSQKIVDRKKIKVVRVTKRSNAKLVKL